MGFEATGEVINSLCRWRDDLIDEIGELKRLLRFEHELCYGVTPFNCSNLDCCYYGQRAQKSCDCYSQKCCAHAAEVARALKDPRG